MITVKRKPIRLLTLSLILIIMAALLLSACASSRHVALPETSSQNDFAPPQQEGSSTGKTDADTGSQTGGNQLADRKIVRNGQLALEAADVAKAYDALLAEASRLGGYELSRDFQESGGRTRLNAQIRIPPDNLDTFMAYAGTVGKVTLNKTTSQDISEAYFDVETRIGTMEKSLERYYALLEKSTDIENTLRVQKQIDDLTVELESLKGKLNLWKRQVAESTVSVSLVPPSDPVVAKKPVDWSALSFQDMLYLMQSGLTSVANTIVRLLQWLLIAVVSLLPILLPLLVLFLIVRAILRRNRRRRSAAAAASYSSTLPGTAERGGTAVYPAENRTTVQTNEQAGWTPVQPGEQLGRTPVQPDPRSTEQHGTDTHN